MNLFLTIEPIYLHILWSIIVIIMLVVEFSTDDLTSIWFAVGALVALIMSICGVNSFLAQFGVFLGVSLVLLLCLRKVLKKWLMKNKVATNADALIGKKIEILKDADSFNPGEGKVNGLIWTVICEDDDKVCAGDIAIINKIIGNKLIVKKQ